MNGAIELPGEAAPLTPQQILFALQSAGSSQQQLIQTGTQQLQTWESQPGYHSLLQAVYLDKSLPTEVRYLAIIQLKNGIDKYWRKSAPNAIKATEKAEIRSHLVEGNLGEADSQLALQSALAISKVVRIDYPNEWPEVLTNLISILRVASEANQLRLRRGLLILLRIVKEMATARLRRSQTSLQSVTPEIVILLGQIYTHKVGQWIGFLSSNENGEGDAVDAMENSLLALKIIKRLLLVGYEYPNHHKEVQELWDQSQYQFGQFLDMVTREPAIIVSPAMDFVQKHLVQFAKLHSGMGSSHPAAYALLPNSLDLTRAYWGLIMKFGDTYSSLTADWSSKATSLEKGLRGERDFMEKLALKGMILLRACMKMVFSPKQSFKWRPPEIRDEQDQATVFFKTQLLTDSLVCQMADVIVMKFFVFRPADLEAWEEESDEWEIRENGGGDTWEFEIRPCSEKLFMDLVLNYKHLLVQPLLGFFQAAMNTSQSSIVTKDAIYTAMGLSAAVVYEEFNFDAFLTSTLVNDVQQTGPNCKVLRRRVSILLGQWITVKVGGTSRPLVYQIFQHLLNPKDETNDQVVRVTAARQLQIAVEDFSFKPDPFLPYAPDLLSRLMALIQEVENTETKMAVLATIRAIAVRLEHRISPYADQIVSLLPGLWDASGEEHLMKQAIFVILSTLVSSMMEQSQRYNPLVLPLIQRAVEPGSEMQVYLMEESLDLWSAILKQAPAPAAPDLIQLASHIFPLLELGSENLRMALTIVESYVLLAPEAMLADGIRLRILSYMTSLLAVNRRELAGYTTTIVEKLIRAAEKLGGAKGVSVICKDLYESGHLEKIMNGLHDAWQAHQTVGPERRYPKLDDVVETDYFMILARVALADPATLISLLSAVGDAAATWSWLSAEWFRHFDSMANIDRQKLSCLALTRLLELPTEFLAPLILTRLQDYFSMWTSVVYEMQDGRDDVGGDNLIWELDTKRGQFDTLEDMRQRVLSTSDPVHTEHTFNFVKARLGSLVERCGGQEQFRQEWLINVDTNVVAGFQALSEGRAAEEGE